MLEEGDYVESREDLKPTEKAKIARACPVRVKGLKKGDTYLYCTCGHSLKQPFCDGKHRETQGGFKPLKVIIDRDQRSFVWCACKRNDPGAGPSCDGNHTRIDDWLISLIQYIRRGKNL